MKISKLARRGAKELFRSCLVNGLLDENRARQVVSLVIAAKPRGYLQILSQFLRLVKLELQRRAAKVESAVPLAEDLQTTVRSNLGRGYGAGLSISFVQNPALIGGLRIKVGSDVYDGSVQFRLKELEQSL
ncbi:H+transporting two-sector ATPase delta (OSCP) subunit [Verrucomicrobia bacterium]|nr:H+transporting two-sector ATPase delta (OSCP) subunit [Verrucomicrobiota bacterium]